MGKTMNGIKHFCDKISKQRMLIHLKKKQKGKQQYLDQKRSNKFKL